MIDPSAPAIRQAFRTQGEACSALGSPFMGRLMPLIAERLQPGGAVADRVLGWEGDPGPSGDSVPLRLAGALHALKLRGRALQDVYPPFDADDAGIWRAVQTVLEEHAGHILEWLDSPPQTNEVRRAAAILPTLAHVNARYGRPVDLLELGASAGLNLRADRFCLALPVAVLGDAGSAVRLEPEWTGSAPPGGLPEVVARSGVDLSPVDPEDADGRLRLLAYLWPDQPDRIRRTEAAIEIARRVKAEVTKGDAAAWLEATLAEPAPEGRLRVVYHTVAWQYFPDETKARCLAAMRAAPSPLVRIAMEADGGEGAGLTVTHYPLGDSEALARVDFHGRWVKWHGQSRSDFPG